MIKTFWLSFCDPDKPEGERFLGVAVVDVTDINALKARKILRAKFPNALEGAEWIAAATTVARDVGCNPGGEVASYELPPNHPNTERCPRNKLLSRAALIELDLL